MKGHFRSFYLLLIMIPVFLFTGPATNASSKELKASELRPIASLVREAIRKGQVPGAVVLIGNEDRIVYRKAFGSRQLRPVRRPMTVDTIFDLASLTKVIATTTAVMRLSEQGLLDLNAPVALYWPEFGTNRKDPITIKDLLTHYSGLRPDLDGGKWAGYDEALGRIIRETPVCDPGSRFIYSDINFEVLGELVRRVSGITLDAYCEQYIFGPLGMKDTFFKPPPSLRSRIAPTEVKSKNTNEFLWGEVHDPTAGRMGGIAGHAGVFSTADDLAIFSRMLLYSGRLGKVKILEAPTVTFMISPNSPAGREPVRGLGWNMAAPFFSNRAELPAAGTCWHTGYTGTALWIDTVTKTYVIILTNRVHPQGRGDAGPLRKQIVGVVAKALGPVPDEHLRASTPALPAVRLTKKIAAAPAGPDRVRTGIDVLAEEGFAPLAGKRVGLITNHTGVDAAGVRTIDLLREAKEIRLTALFSPEHGIAGVAEGQVAAGRDETAGLAIFSLYGKTLRPTDGMLEGLDALVFDIQDAGVRFYTYITTMAYAMEAASRRGIPFFVLDRPNPLNASVVQGPVLDRALKSFTGYFPIPVRHGMTVGELARMFNEEGKINADLTVVKMKGYRRSYWYDETGLQWINPSPNLRSLVQAALYPGVAMVEGANVSVGRGTDTPFELMGAPWIGKEELAAYLNSRGIRGVRFEPTDFTPVSDIYRQKTCHGFRIILEDRDALDSPRLGIEIVSALWRLYPTEFQVNKTIGMVGSRTVLTAIKGGQDPREISDSSQPEIEDFRKVREKYLLY